MTRRPFWCRLGWHRDPYYDPTFDPPPKDGLPWVQILPRIRCGHCHQIIGRGKP